MNLNHKFFCPKVIISDEENSKGACQKECVELENAMLTYKRKSENVNCNLAEELKDDNASNSIAICENQECTKVVNDTFYPKKESFHLIHRYQEFLSSQSNIIEIINNPLFEKFNIFYNQLKDNTLNHLQNYVNKNINILPNLNESQNINNFPNPCNKNKYFIKSTLIRADCIRKRIKTHFNQYLYRRICEKMKDFSANFSLCKLSQKFIADVKLESNKLILNKSIKEVFTTDFENKNKSPNKKLFESISLMKNADLDAFFNRTYSAFYNEYLNSLEFENDSIKLRQKEGVEYYQQFLKFSRDNIDYYEKGIPYRKNYCSHNECSNLILNEATDIEFTDSLKKDCDDNCNNCN